VGMGLIWTGGRLFLVIPWTWIIFTFLFVIVVLAFYVTFLFVCLAFLTREVQVHIHPLILCFFLIRTRNTLMSIEPEVRRDRHSTITRLNIAALSDHHARRISHYKTNPCNL